MNQGTDVSTTEGQAHMFDTIGRSRGTDFFRIADQLTPEERDYWNRTRHFVDDEVLPVINDYWERAEFPRPWSRSWGGSGSWATGSWATGSRATAARR